MNLDESLCFKVDGVFPLGMRMLHVSVRYRDQAAYTTFVLANWRQYEQSILQITHTPEASLRVRDFSTKYMKNALYLHKNPISALRN